MDNVLIMIMGYCIMAVGIVGIIHAAVKTYQLIKLEKKLKNLDN